MSSILPLLVQTCVFILVVVTQLYAQSDEPTTEVSVSDFFARYEKKTPWSVPTELIQSMEAAEPGINFDEYKVRSYTLPDLFVLENGERVVGHADWEKHRRPEMIDAICRTLYGYAPPKPDNLSFEIVEHDSLALSGRATFKRIKIGFQIGPEPFFFHLSLFVPKLRAGRVPVFLFLNHRRPNATDPSHESSVEFWPVAYLIERGYAAAAVNVSTEVEPDRPNATTGIRYYYQQNHPNADAFTWGALGAWAWAGSRAADYLQTDSDIDSSRMAVNGHSRGGKAAMWNGAQDTRFALTCVNDPGRSGPGLIRRNLGRGIAGSVRNFPHWFSPIHQSYADSVDALPYDGHFLVALIAPRALHMGLASRYLHSDPRGIWLSLHAGMAAWALFGQNIAIPDEMPLVNDLFTAGPIAYHMHEGGHALTMFDWKLYLDHADMVWKNKPK